ncbi:MAG: ABC transporter permease [Thermoleophilaceae bacterium]|nr:ABC transporter permease [Thermoleophilaceae bacterium]
MSAREVYEMKGPAAVSGDWRRFLDLTRMLAITDFKLRFFGSILGYLWTLMRPLMLFGVLYVVFSQVVRLGDQVPFYPVVLLSAMILYFYFSEATTKAVTCVVQSENLVRKIQFPRLAIPLASVGAVSLQFALNLLVLLAFLALSGVKLHSSIVQLPLILVALLALTAGTSMLLSAVYVVARDVAPIWEVVIQTLFYATPILYPVELLSRESESLARVAMANPLAVIVQQMRHAVIDPTAPSAAQAIGGWGWMLVPAAITVALLIAGYVVFDRMAPRIAEEL